MKENLIDGDRAKAIKAEHDGELRRYIASIEKPGVVMIEEGLAIIEDTSILEENSGSQGWCRLPYKLTSRSMPEGCPNHGSEFRALSGFGDDIIGWVIRECPPTRFLERDIFDLKRPVYVIYNIFPVGRYAEMIRKKSTKLKTWAECYNPRYWQMVARQEIYAKCAAFLVQNPGTVVDLCPEAHGVDLTKVMAHMGIILEFGPWPPKHSMDNIRYQICLAGYPSNAEKLTAAGLIGRDK